MPIGFDHQIPGTRTHVLKRLEEIARLARQEGDDKTELGALRELLRLHAIEAPAVPQEAPAEPIKEPSLMEKIRRRVKDVLQI